MQDLKSLAEIKKLYKGKGIVTIYAYLRFWEYPRLERIEKMIPKEGIVIDLGSGYGIFSNYLAIQGPKRKVIALEFDEKKVAIAEEAAKKGGIENISFFSKDITKLKIPSADAIIIMQVLHHLKGFPEQEKLLKACVTKIKKGGTLLVDEVDKKTSLRLVLAWLTDALLYLGDTFYYLTREKMLNILKKNDLEIEIRNVSNFLMPYPEIVYLCKKK